MVVLKLQIYKTIIIENISENYERDFSTSSELDKKYWEMYDCHYGNRDLFYESDNKVIFSLLPINPLYIKNICKLFGWKNILNLFPQKKSLSICEDIISDKELYKNFIHIVKSNPKIKIVPLRHTKEFYSLMAHLREKNISFVLPEKLPNEVEFFRDYYDTKLGFRLLANQTLSKDSMLLKIPEGYVVFNLTDLIEASYFFLLQNKSFIIKGNKGSQGDSLLVVDKNSCPKEKYAFINYLKPILERLSWWSGSAVVEEYIESSVQDLFFSPSVECVVKPNGVVDYLYAGYQLFDKNTHSYIGIYIDPKTISDVHIKNAVSFAKRYGKVLHGHGYTGYFDVDLISSNENTTYAVESNLRRTGGTFVHDAVVGLYGSTYNEFVYAIGIELHSRKYAIGSYETVLNDFKDLLFTKEKGFGIIVVTPDLIEFGMITLILIHKESTPLFDLLTEVRRRFA